MTTENPSIPSLTTEDARHLARRLYGLEGDIESLPGERSQNFQLRDPGGQIRVLKIANADETQSMLEAQVRALEHLASRLSTGTVQTPLPSLDGALLTEIKGERGTRHIAHLLTFLPGSSLAGVPRRSPELLRSLGHLIATIDRELADFDHPAAHRDLVWDLTRASTQWANTATIQPARRRFLAEQFLTEFEQHVIPILDNLPAGVIHNDGNDHNVLVSDTQDVRAVSLIDFGDLVHSRQVFGLAIAAAYAMFGSSHPLAAAAEVVTGYHAVRPLDDLELEALFPAIRARLAVSVTISASRKLERPDDSYVTVSEGPAWDVMDRLAGVDLEVARQCFDNACGRNQADARELGRSPEEILETRRRHLGPSLSLSYRQPLKIVRGWMQYLFDNSGRPFLDCVNNVCHVGHCHPEVVAANRRQMARLNTNTRYLHDNLANYAERLVATLPDPLSVCYFVCTGSEANDLALRLARTFTGHQGIAVVDGDYHGHTGCLIEISPYKHDGPGGLGTPDHVRKVTMPDTFRQRHPAETPQTGEMYAAEVATAVEQLRQSRHGFAAFFSESILSCGGQIVPAEGYFKYAFQHVRAAGGVCVLDEVQVGFGRVGSHFWAFETQGIVPDIVTIGKPIGNGHPLAAVITTPEIAAAFDNGMEYFNTFGGNPVSCAVGLAVLDVIEQEGLQAHALEVGDHLLRGLEGLKQRYPLIGDVRGRGLFLGAEFVKNLETLEPAADEASEVVDRMKHRGYLLSTDGPLYNVIKIKPPLTFTRGNADDLLYDLDQVLAELS